MIKLLHKRRGGFTLIELLVVIGIMSILAAILLPALLRARAHARHGRWMTGIRASNRIDPNCVLFFTFERETISGTEVKNLAEAPGRGRHHLIDSPDGIITGAVEAEGRFPGKTALRFDGGDDYVDAGSSASLNFGFPVTLEAWVNPSYLPWAATIVTRRAGYAQVSWGLRSENGRLSFYFGDGGWQWVIHQTATPILTLNEWQHVVVVYDGLNVRLHRNGVRVYFEPETAMPWTGTANVTIGAFVGSVNEPWHGLIGEVAIFDRALSADEIRVRFEGGRP